VTSGMSPLGHPDDLVNVARGILARLEADQGVPGPANADHAQRIAGNGGHFGRAEDCMRASRPPCPAGAGYKPALSEPALGERQMRVRPS
jgi:hypothetical protein